jgi:hypothetical protein
MAPELSGLSILYLMKIIISLKGQLDLSAYAVENGQNEHDDTDGYPEMWQRLSIICRYSVHLNSCLYIEIIFGREDSS